MNPIQGLIPEPSRITTLKGKFTLDNNVIISWWEMKQNQRLFYGLNI